MGCAYADTLATVYLLPLTRGQIACVTFAATGTMRHGHGMGHPLRRVMLADSALRTAESDHADAMGELGELAELWLDRHVKRQDNAQVSIAIQQTDRESRRLERKMRG